MAVIEINHKMLRDVAIAVMEYCDGEEQERNTADSKVEVILYSDLIGVDAQKFRLKWEAMKEKKENITKFRESLKKFSQDLNDCAKVYETAQEEVYQEAEQLPKWIYW